MTAPTADTVPHTRRPALRWFVTWTLTYIITQGIAVACNVVLIATDAFGRTTENHDQPGFDGALGQTVSWWWGVVLIQLPQLVLALTVLWFVGRRLGPVKFRLLSLLMFLWYSPVFGIFWNGGFALETWVLTQLVFALLISRPRQVGPLRQPTDAMLGSGDKHLTPESWQPAGLHQLPPAGRAAVMRAEPHYKTTIDLFVAPITGQQLSVAGLSAVPVSTLALVVETGRHPRSGLHRDVTLENGVRQ